MNEKLSTATNSLNWFEIAARDISRAKQFYETIFEVEMTPMEMTGMKMAMFPYEDSKGKVSGALVQSDLHQPGGSGTIVYLNANPNLQMVVDKIEKAGGKVIMSKTLIDEHTGYMALFTDTEGNIIGLHSMK